MAALEPILSDEREARVLEAESVGVCQPLDRERRTAYRAVGAAIDAIFGVLQVAGRIELAHWGLVSLIRAFGSTRIY